MKYGNYLSSDIARCAGKTVRQCVTHAAGEEPSDSDRQVHIIPQIRIDGYCENAIHALKEEVH